MKTAAVICEFNPFHNGHRYLLEKIKGDLGFERIVCIMSGNYVQRGEPAVLCKYSRAAMAVRAGADLVLELPTVWATSSAAEFALGAVRTAAALPFCSALVFGSEPGYGVKELDGFRKLLPEENSLRNGLRNGLSWPAAVSAAGGAPRLSPNALLACSYLNALEQADPGRRIRPVAVDRSGDGYDAGVPSGKGFASAASIRRLLASGDTQEASLWMPEPPDLSHPVFPDSFTDLLNDRLLREEEPQRYLDISEQIAGRLKNRKYRIMSFSERIEDTKTRQYTRSRISRGLLHLVLGIRKEELEALKSAASVPYFRVLAYRRGSGLLSGLAEQSGVPVYTKNAVFYRDWPEQLCYDQLWRSAARLPSEFLLSPYIV